ncbi:MAG: CvpA family protein [Myxococcota bacterium]
MRGFFVGFVKEGFSIAAIGGAYLAVQIFSLPTAAWLEHVSGGGISGEVAPWTAGAILAIGTITGVVLLGRGLRRTLTAAGLNWADRAGGGLLGAAEGILVAGILIGLGAEILGRDHPASPWSRSSNGSPPRATSTSTSRPRPGPSDAHPPIWRRCLRLSESRRACAAGVDRVHRSGSYAGSAHRPLSRIRSTSRSSADDSGTLRTTSSLPT